MDKDIVPELLQADSTPAVISNALLKILEDESCRQDMINDLSSTDTTNRLLKYLYSLKEKKGSSVIKLPIPKRDLAMLLGAAPETISRLFTKLQNDGLIKINGKEITILEKDN